MAVSVVPGKFMEPVIKKSHIVAYFLSILWIPVKKMDFTF